MRLSIPITGTVLVEGSIWGDGKLTGDDKDPIRPVSIDLGNVSWRMVDIDLKNEVMEIEVTPCDTVSEPELDAEGKQKFDAESNPISIVRPTTEEERAGFLQYAQKLIKTHTKDELYQMSSCSRLKRPFKGK